MSLNFPSATDGIPWNDPTVTDTSLIRIPRYYGQFPMSQQNSHLFSFLYGLSLIRTTETKSQPQRVNLHKLKLFFTDTAVIGDQVSPESQTVEYAQGESCLADELCKVI